MTEEMLTQEELDAALTRVVELSARLANALATGVPVLHENKREDLASKVLKLNAQAARLHERIWRLRESERERYRREQQSFRAEMNRQGTLREYEDFIATRGED